VINLRTVDCFLASYSGTDKVRFHNLDGSPFCGDSTVQQVRRDMGAALRAAPLTDWCLTLGSERNWLIGLLAAPDGPILVVNADPAGAIPENN
jgi:hypothetical protein